MVVGRNNTSKNHTTNLMPTRVTKIPTHVLSILRRDNFRTIHWLTTLVNWEYKAIYRQKQSLKYCTYILMKVHTLDIDSSERDTAIYPHANNYIVSLKNPIYDISKITLVSARIPTPQLLVNTSNKTFSIDDVNVTLDETNYSNGTDLASDLDLKLQPPTSNVDSVVFDSDTNALVFSNTSAGAHDFTFQFYSGTNGYTSNISSVTTPHQILGFSSEDASSTSNVLTSGYINLEGPNSLILRLTAGSDEFTKTVYSSTPFYTGHILLNGTDVINHHSSDDTLSHEFHRGPQKFIRDIQVEFFYMSHGRLIPYDFRNQDHILKFEITCSTDKLEGLPKVSPDVVKKALPPPVSIPEFENPYRWNQILPIMIVSFIGIVFLMLTRRKPRLSE